MQLFHILGSCFGTIVGHVEDAFSKVLGQPSNTLGRALKYPSESELSVEILWYFMECTVSTKVKGCLDNNLQK